MPWQKAIQNEAPQIDQSRMLYLSGVGKKQTVILCKYSFKILNIAKIQCYSNWFWYRVIDLFIYYPIVSFCIIIRVNNSQILRFFVIVFIVSDYPRGLTSTAVKGCLFFGDYPDLSHILIMLNQLLTITYLSVRSLLIWLGTAIKLIVVTMCIKY